MPKIHVLRSFRHCVGGDVHPTAFAKGDEPTVDDRTAEVAIENEWAKPVGKTRGKPSDGQADG